MSAACGWWLHRERQQYALNRQLIAALLKRDTTTSFALVNAGADPNTRVLANPAPSLKLLFGHLLHHTPPSVNASDTALMIACGFIWIAQSDTSTKEVQVPENLSLLRAMLAHGADVHARDFFKFTPLHTAVNTGRRQTAERLLQYGADANAQDSEGTTLLEWAQTNRTLDMQRLLLAYGANPNVPDKQGETALHNAVQESNAASRIALLLAHGADPNLRNKEGLTPLQLAQKANRPDLVRLLKHGTK